MKKIILFGLILSIILSLGCSKSHNDILQGEPEEDFIEVGGPDREIITRSENISNTVVELFGIDDAVTVLFNNTALVGVVLAYDQELNDELKEIIVSKVKEEDKFINEVKISEKEKIFKQLDNIINDLLNGKSYDSFVSEISKIMDKIDKEK